MNTSASRPSGRSFAREAAQRFLVALVFGLLVAAVINSSVARNVPILDKARQQGGALGVQLAMTWHDFTARYFGGASVALPSGATRISMIDIDEAACASFSSFTRCRFDRIGQPQLLAEVLAAADAAAPRVIVFDVVLPSSQDIASSHAAQEILARVQQPGPPIIAPIPYANNPQGDIGINWADSICGQPVCGRLRYAPAFAEERYGVVRGYPAYVMAATVPDAGAPEDQIRTQVRLPSLALAASQATGGVVAAPMGPVQILYTIPSFANIDREATREVLSAAEWDSVDYLRASQTVFGTPPEIRFPERPNNILLIGSSAPVTADWHDTPLGTMTGMEIVANAIRTMELRRGDAVASEPHHSGRFDLMAWAGLGLAIILLTATDRARERRFGGDAPLIDRYTFKRLLILSVALVLEVVLKVAEVVSELGRPEMRTGDLDILFPLVAIFFTTAVETSQRLIVKMERLAEIAFERVAGFALRVREGLLKA